MKQTTHVKALGEPVRCVGVSGTLEPCHHRAGLLLVHVLRVPLLGSPIATCDSTTDDDDDDDDDRQTGRQADRQPGLVKKKQRYVSGEADEFLLLVFVHFWSERRERLTERDGVVLMHTIYTGPTGDAAQSATRE